ncbi:MAG: response regulator [Desulfatibacillaceae bacterium]
MGAYRKLLHIVTGDRQDAESLGESLKRGRPGLDYVVQHPESVSYVGLGHEILLLKPSLRDWKWLGVMLHAIADHPHMPVVLYVPDGDQPPMGLLRVGDNTSVSVARDMEALAQQVDMVTREEERVRKNILFVDDDAMVLKAFTRLLRKTPWTVYTVTDAERAMNLLEVEDVDVVVTDIKMPNIHGLDLIKRIRELNLEVPIVVCSGYAGMREDVELKYYRISDFIEKPVNAADFKRRIEAVMG